MSTISRCFVLLALATSVTSCAVGNAGPGCTPCPIGSWSYAGATSCTPCAPGYSCPIASVGPAACYPLPAGSSALSAATAGCAVGNAGPGCTPCPVGSWSYAGATQCTLCPSGFSCPIASVGPAACYPLPAAAAKAAFSRLATAAGCAVGNAGPGCTPCPIGSWSLAGATSCTKCALGYSSPIASVGPDACYPIASNTGAAGCAVGNAGPGCTPCPIGSYSLAGASQCTSCPSGFSSPIASVGPDACYPLPAAAVSRLAVVPSALYHYLLSQPCTSVLSGDFGGTTLNSAVYCVPSAVSLSASVILDAQNNNAAVFIFQIDGALTTAAGLTITVINGQAQVYYAAVGAATLGAGSVVTGTIVALQAITLGANSHVTELPLSLVGTVNIGAGATIA